MLSASDAGRDEGIVIEREARILAKRAKAATKCVRERCPDDAELILEMLGLDHA